MFKVALLTGFVSLLISQHSIANDLGRILRDSKGIPLGFNLFEALTACPSGTRLPTLREFATYGQSKGAKGILEVSQVDPHNVPAGYNYFELENVGGSKDSFYYNAAGFQRSPNDAFSYLYFWSISAMGDYATIYMGTLGAVGMHGLHQKLFVTCVPNH